MKTVHLLIGPKGSGKTFIGSVLERELGITFLRVEPIWLGLAQGEDGWHKVEATIDEFLSERDEIIIESLGAGDGFVGMRDRLKEKYHLNFIKIHTDLAECLRRVKARSSKDHIPVSDAEVKRYNAIADEVVHPWTTIIENNSFLSVQDIVEVFQRINYEQSRDGDTGEAV